MPPSINSKKDKTGPIGAAPRLNSQQFIATKKASELMHAQAVRFPAIAAQTTSSTLGVEIIKMNSMKALGWT